MQVHSNRYPDWIALFIFDKIPDKIPIFGRDSGAGIPVDCCLTGGGGGGGPAYAQCLVYISIVL